MPPWTLGGTIIIGGRAKPDGALGLKIVDKRQKSKGLRITFRKQNKSFVQILDLKLIQILLTIKFNKPFLTVAMFNSQ